MEDELFTRLGGAEAVKRIVDGMYQRVLADPELSPFFEGVQLERLRKMQYEFIASALGGPVTYGGTELQAAHRGRGITQQHFAKFVGHLAAAMEAEGVSNQDVDQMLGRMALYRDRIVGGVNVDG
jgi:hemoglobin